MDDAAELSDEFVTVSRALVGIAVHSVAMAPVEITVPQFRLLLLVAAHGPRTVGDIAERLGVNQSNASRICDRLQRLHLIERKRPEEDARVVCVSLTAAGQDLVEAVMKHRSADIRRVTDRLSPDDAAAALRALRAFNAAAGELDEEHWSRLVW